VRSQLQCSEFGTSCVLCGTSQDIDIPIIEFEVVSHRDAAVGYVALSFAHRFMAR